MAGSPNGKSVGGPHYVQIALYAAGHGLALAVGAAIWGMWQLLSEFQEPLLWAWLICVALQDAKNWLVSQLTKQLETRSLPGLAFRVMLFPLLVVKDTVDELGRVISAAVEEERELQHAVSMTWGRMASGSRLSTMTSGPLLAAASNTVSPSPRQPHPGLSRWKWRHRVHHRLVLATESPNWLLRHTAPYLLHLWHALSVVYKSTKAALHYTRGRKKGARHRHRHHHKHHGSKTHHPPSAPGQHAAAPVPGPPDVSTTPTKATPPTFSFSPSHPATPQSPAAASMFSGDGADTDGGGSTTTWQDKTDHEHAGNAGAEEEEEGSGHLFLWLFRVMVVQQVWLLAMDLDRTTLVLWVVCSLAALWLVLTAESRLKPLAERLQRSLVRWTSSGPSNTDQTTATTDLTPAASLQTPRPGAVLTTQLPSARHTTTTTPFGHHEVQTTPLAMSPGTEAVPANGSTGMPGSNTHGSPHRHRKGRHRKGKTASHEEASKSAVSDLTADVTVASSSGAETDESSEAGAGRRRSGSRQQRAQGVHAGMHESATGAAPGTAAAAASSSLRRRRQRRKAGVGSTEGAAGEEPGLLHPSCSRSQSESGAVSQRPRRPRRRRAQPQPSVVTQAGQLLVQLVKVALTVVVFLAVWTARLTWRLCCWCDRRIRRSLINNINSVVSTALVVGTLLGVVVLGVLVVVRIGTEGSDAVMHLDQIVRGRASEAAAAAAHIKQSHLPGLLGALEDRRRLLSTNVQQLQLKALSMLQTSLPQMVSYVDSGAMYLVARYNLTPFMADVERVYYSLPLALNCSQEQYSQFSQGVASAELQLAAAQARLSAAEQQLNHSQVWLETTQSAWDQAWLDVQRGGAGGRDHSQQHNTHNVTASDNTYDSQQQDGYVGNEQRATESSSQGSSEGQDESSSSGTGHHQSDHLADLHTLAEAATTAARSASQAAKAATAAAQVAVQLMASGEGSASGATDPESRDRLLALVAQLTAATGTSGTQDTVDVADGAGGVDRSCVGASGSLSGCGLGTLHALLLEAQRNLTEAQTEYEEADKQFSQCRDTASLAERKLRACHSLNTLDSEDALRRLAARCLQLLDRVRHSDLQHIRHEVEVITQEARSLFLHLKSKVLSLGLFSPPGGPSSSPSFSLFSHITPHLPPWVVRRLQHLQSRLSAWLPMLPALKPSEANTAAANTDITVALATPNAQSAASNISGLKVIDAVQDGVAAGATAGSTPVAAGTGNTIDSSGKPVSSNQLFSLAGAAVNLGQQLGVTESLTEVVSQLSSLTTSTLSRVFGSITALAGGTTSLALDLGASLYNAVSMAFSFAMEFGFFVATLLYLLSSGEEPLSRVIRLMPLDKQHQDMACRALSHAMQAVFLSSLKLAIFHAGFTWVTLRAAGTHFTTLLTLGSALLAVVPVLPVWWPVIPAALELALSYGHYAGAVLLIAVQMLVSGYVDDVIIGEMGGGGYLTGLGIAGGMALFSNPLKGVLLGPMCLALVSAAYHLHGLWVDMDQD